MDKMNFDDIMRIEDDPNKQHTYDPAVKPPPFGHPLKVFWALDPQYLNLNHGSYGSLPLPVLTACGKLYLLAERNPDLFHRKTYMPILAQARGQVAELIGADTEEVVLVPNTTHGINTILRNFEWKEGDVVLDASTTYGAISNTLQYLADRSEQPRPVAHAITYTFPMTHAEICDSFRAKLKELKAQYPNTTFSDTPPDSRAPGKADRSGNKFVTVIDSITSNPGIIMPWKEMVQICKDEGVWSVIDAAHSIGQEFGINLSDAKPDFWVSNCHKWLYSKRGCAALYVPTRNQYIMKSSLPTSHGYANRTPTDTNFVGQHEWTGTSDFINLLSVIPALAFRKWLGGEAAIYSYCHKLAMEGGRKLAQTMGTHVMHDSDEQTVFMTDVQLPLPVEKTRGELYPREVAIKIQLALRERTLFERNTYAAHYFHGGVWWIRASAQAWLEVRDFEELGKIFVEVCDEIKEEFQLGVQ